jgi:hypothetical protein
MKLNESQRMIEERRGDEQEQSRRKRRFIGNDRRGLRKEKE